MRQHLFKGLNVEFNAGANTVRGEKHDTSKWQRRADAWIAFVSYGRVQQRVPWAEFFEILRECVCLMCRRVLRFHDGSIQSSYLLSGCGGGGSGVGGVGDRSNKIPLRRSKTLGV